MKLENRILLVEDEVLIAKLESRQLTSYGYTVTHALSGEEALDLVQSQESNFDLVLMDIDLGHGMDGIQTAIQILQLKELPVVFLSSHTEVEIVEKTQQVTSYGYVVKGSGITVLDASIKMAYRLFQEKWKVQQHQKSLEEAERNFSEILQYSTEGILSINSDYKVITINEAAKKEYYQCFSANIEIGDSFLDAIPYHYQSDWRRRINLAFKGEPYQTDLEIENNGNTFWSDVRIYPIFRDGKIARVGVFSRDITEKQEVEAAARIQEEKYKNLFLNIAEEIHLWKVIRNQTGQIISWKLEDVNPAGLNAWNKTREETIGKETGEIWPETNPVEQFLPIVNQIFRDRLPYSWESYFPGTDQTLRMTSTSFGEYFFSIGQDVTEYRQTEARLKKEIQEKETLLREIHHRVKNNVTSIEGFLDLQLQASNQAEVQEALRCAISYVTAVRVLYDRMLMNQNFNQISLKNYLTSLIDAFLDLYNKNNQVHVSLSIQDILVKANLAIPLGIIANELLTNSFKYAFSGKNETPAQISVTLREEKQDGNLIFVVQDNGIGFDRSLTTFHPGFGISMVEMLAESLKGKLMISNENGTKCFLKFPLV